MKQVIMAVFFITSMAISAVAGYNADYIMAYGNGAKSVKVERKVCGEFEGYEEETEWLCNI